MSWRFDKLVTLLREFFQEGTVSGKGFNKSQLGFVGDSFLRQPLLCFDRDQRCAWPTLS